MNKGISWPLDRNMIRQGKRNHTFGMVRRKADGTRRAHQGWDFAAADGTPCYAVADGRVMAVSNHGAYGQQLLLAFSHDFDGDGTIDKLFAFYAHLSRVDVGIGMAVGRGQQLGLTGSSGNAAGLPEEDKHLHFELRHMPFPGLGLVGRYSPLELFGHCPLHGPVYRVEQAA